MRSRKREPPCVELVGLSGSSDSDKHAQTSSSSKCAVPASPRPHPDARPRASSLSSSPKEPSKRQRRLHFAPGPWSGKFDTADGHPNHEGIVARPKRSLSPRFPVPLTISMVQALEPEIGSICPHSLERLKRRVGLIPLLTRNKPYITHRAPRPLSAAKRCLAQLDLDSDTDSDAPPPSPRCRRRRLFPVSFGQLHPASPRPAKCPGASQQGEAEPNLRGERPWRLAAGNVPAKQSSGAKQPAKLPSLDELPVRIRRGMDADELLAWQNLAASGQLPRLSSPSSPPVSPRAVLHSLGVPSRGCWGSPTPPLSPRGRLSSCSMATFCGSPRIKPRA